MGCLVTRRASALPLPRLLLLVALVALACGHRAYLWLFLYVRVSSRWYTLIPSKNSFCGVGCLFVRVCFSSPLVRLVPGVFCCGLVPCRMRPVGRRQYGGAWMVVPLCLYARAGWCVVYSSPSLLYPFPPLASGALLACLRSCGSSVGGGLRWSCFPYLVVLLVLALGCPWWWCVALSLL